MMMIIIIIVTLIQRYTHKNARYPFYEKSAELNCSVVLEVAPSALKRYMLELELENISTQG